MTTYYLSKYALSEGVEKVESDDRYSKGDWIDLQDRYGFYKLGRDIHKVEAEALAAAESMRVKKIASLKKQIAKLEAMTFKVQQ